ncbi:peptidylprolyl isomerase [Arcobacter sp. L]|jgi:FKBP-type peptidyl-prolyl cis-trans isomerase SlyD|uniref:FKBP-type peptidyl-prolyl cis-trans isomerase n=1 Tax=Arcobacter sp. L TaxID=944547 RepID=UPI000229642E|nr:peptidylprolyl isomerase [Arcobacter sp. L]BAK72582.1 peptidylprolyl isomerase [Arcobacter sp. L]
MAIEINQTVKIMFEVKIDGVIVDGSRSNKPFEFQFGTGQVIAGLEKRIINMKAGEIADIFVPASEAYGEYDPAGIQTLPIEQFAGIENLKVGMQIQAQDENDQPIQFIVKEIGEKEITVDFNHPLAGKDLEYKIKIDSLL